MIAIGYCQCGCGEKTSIAKATCVSAKDICVKGEPRRFLAGHHWRLRRNTLDKYWSYVVKTSECWIWGGSIYNSAYGIFKLGSKRYMAHRLAWELTYGPIPNGLFVLHKCDNPPCVNPDHLFLGTQQDNMTDKMNKGRHRTPTGEKAPWSKITEQDVRQIRNDTRSYNEISKDYPVSPTTIGEIKRHLIWKHVV